MNVVRSISEKKAEEAAAAIIVAAIGDSNCPARGKVGKPRQSHTYIVMELVKTEIRPKKKFILSSNRRLGYPKSVIKRVAYFKLNRHFFIHFPNFFPILEDFFKDVESPLQPQFGKII